MTNLLSANFESKLGGNYEDIAKKNTLAYNNDTTSNFYKEKYKKELATQKEINKQNKDELIKQGGITILFASHYTELKFEYLILKNYINIPIKSIQFYNCPEDEMFKDFKLDNLSIFDKEKTSDNQLLFKLFSKFLFFIRSFSINHLLKQQKGYLFYTVNQEQKAKGQYISQEKPKRNDPCPCGSGLKYKNCCGKQQ